ncbi:Ubiquitin-conjugating enzyme E2 T [Daphnia magna]|uniref:Ubiquitin-conjugating enzyme E2 T n=1 Tax=Daphnia magna TaxID=35525 RepID=A0A0P5VIU9_9CRUS|nr:Ubiquitin-conjugating enzyme E2 T [Daphnia magna]
MKPELLQFLFSLQQVCENFKRMMPNSIRTMRMSKEIQDLTKNPPHGITCWPKNDRNDLLEAIVQGSEGTPYANGNFRIDIVIPERYPMDPPQLKFLTKVYHPNIDNATGLICLDVLKMPPHGRWRPVNNLSLTLTAVQQLLSDPNPHDPLDSAIAQEYIANRTLFLENAKKWTKLYAVDDSSARPSKRKSMDEEICEDAAKRLRPSSPSKPSNSEESPSKDSSVACAQPSNKIIRPSSPSKPSNSEESPSKDSAVACAQLSNKIMLKRKDDNEPVFHEAPKRSRKSRSLVRSEGDSIPEKQ